jgi:tetratricopeptide (TPR) repeat protein
MQVTLIPDIKIESIERLLIKYASNPEDPETNFYLGVGYESIGHTAPALSYYLRCSERTDNDLLAYEALIRGAYCYQKQGGRDWTAKTLFQHALLTKPERPEAYFLLSRFCRERSQNQDAYIYASQGLRFLDSEFDNLITDVDYHGETGLLFEKAVSGWFWGKVEESVGILNKLYDSTETPINYKEQSKNRLKEFKKWNRPDIDFSKFNEDEIGMIIRELTDDEVYNFWKNKSR